MAHRCLVRVAQRRAGLRSVRGAACVKLSHVVASSAIGPIMPPQTASHAACLRSCLEDLMKTRLALAQLNVTVGDFAGNVAKIVAAARAAHSDGAKLLIAPELAISGYPPEDLLLRPAFYAAS